VPSKQPIILTDEVVAPPALIRVGLDALPSIIRAQGERASRRPFFGSLRDSVLDLTQRTTVVREVRCVEHLDASIVRAIKGRHCIGAASVLRVNR
jgi:hypothetical protein